MAGFEFSPILFKKVLLFTSILNIISLLLLINRINQPFFIDYEYFPDDGNGVPITVILSLICSNLIFLTYLYLVHKNPKFNYGFSFWLFILAAIILGLKFSFIAYANATIGVNFLALCGSDSLCTYLGMDLVTALMLGFLVLIEIFVDYRRHSKKNVNQDLEM